MSTVPAGSSGDIAVIDVVELTLKDEAGLEPKATAETCTNPVPVIVTVAPPEVEPAGGATFVIVGVVINAVARISWPAWL